MSCRRLSINAATVSDGTSVNHEPIRPTTAPGNPATVTWARGMPVTCP